MTKINNKAFTVVELIITFSIVMVISVGLFKVLDSYREKQQQESYRKMINNYKNEITKTIKDDILKLGIKEIKGITCTGYNQGINITFNDNSNSNKDLCVGAEGNDNGVKYGDIFYKTPSKFIKFKDDFLFEESENIELKEVNVINSNKINYLTEKFYSINIKINHTELKENFDINIAGSKKGVETEDILIKENITVEEAENNSNLGKIVYTDDYKDVDFENKFIDELDISNKNLEDLSALSKEKLTINKLIISAVIFNKSDSEIIKQTARDIIQKANINEVVFVGTWTTNTFESFDWSNVKKITIISNETTTNMKALKNATINELDLTKFKAGKIQLNNATINKLYISEIDSNSDESVINKNLASYGFRKINSLIIIPEANPAELKSISSHLKQKITNLTIGEGITVISEDAVKDFGIKSVKFPSNLEEIKGSAFADNQIKEVKFPSKLKTIWSYAFKNSSIKELDFTNIKITGWSYDAFYKNPIEKVICGNSESFCNSLRSTFNLTCNEDKSICSK